MQARTRTMAQRALLLAAAAVAGAELMAQADITITPIPEPVTDVGIGFAMPSASAVSVPSSPDAWGGPRSGSEATLSDRVVDYRIEATLDPVAHTVDGKQKLTWRNRSKETVRSVYLHLYMNAFKSAGSTFFTEQRESGYNATIAPGEWGHITLRSVTQGGARVDWSFVHPDNGPATDETVVRFDLPAPVAPGASTSFDITFLTQLPRVVASTGHVGSFHLVGQWFPKIGVLELPGERGAARARWNVHEYHHETEFYADFGRFDVKLTAPKGYTVGATGELQGPPVEQGGMLTHHYVQGDVHDFAWTADNRTAPPLRGTWSAPGSPQVALSVLFPPDRAASAAPALKAATEALTYFSTTLGPYPYKTLTIVIPPLNADNAGAMEYPTFITVNGYDKVVPRTAAAFDLDLVTIHEVGHSYFHGILASNETEEPMLDEGLNEFWNHRMLRDTGKDAYLGPPLLAALGIAPGFKGFDVERYDTAPAEAAEPLGQNAHMRKQGIGPVYVRSATVLRDLEARIGKEATGRAFKEYYRRWKFRHPSIADLRETLAEVSGQRAAVHAAFAQQVYGTASVDDRIARFASEAEASAKAGGAGAWRTSVTLERRGAPVAQTVVVKFADGSSETVAWDDQQRARTFSWVKPVKAVSAELDPSRLHYLDASKLDDSRTLEADGSAARRWAGDLAAMFSILFSLIATV
ncbi:M1 family metallopeptidase [Massilia sp. CCM 9210]|uniref:M1 family metallopeptidase n=1 Tax=Massilia scottii TaxID=3057166 RepID=UPI0027964FC1|nr:M1 family metallopeptidase [Massilia sp. CCM 9210]MDQ1815306.1 M1 family metallopeptidase [Massilia sp. CCM 9210]